jgi:hypothetical protein
MPPAPAPHRAALLDQLWAALPRLHELRGLRAPLADLADLAGALRWLEHAGSDRPILAGLVGGASCGKSTVFSSLVGRPISQIHYQPHSSLGPVAYVHRRWAGRLLACERRFLPTFRLCDHDGGAGPTTGSPESLVVARHDEPAWEQLALFDLPDMTSESARREGYQAAHVLPWLDLVLWMVDPNDYLFDDLYIDFIERVSSLGQRAVVLVNDIHGQVDPSSAVLAERIGRFRPDRQFILPPLRCGAEAPYPLFGEQPSFVALRGYLTRFGTRRPVAPLVERVQRHAAALVEENDRWQRLAHAAETSVARLVATERKRILRGAPVLDVLPPSVREQFQWRISRFWEVFRKGAGGAIRQLQGNVDELNVEPLHTYLVGGLKQFGVSLHRLYLESGWVRQLQEVEPAGPVRGCFDVDGLDFRDEVRAVAQFLLDGARTALPDAGRPVPAASRSLAVAVLFFTLESVLRGVTLVAQGVGQRLSHAVATLSPDLARWLPLDAFTRLAIDARDRLATTLDRQMDHMVRFYWDDSGYYLAAGDPLLTVLQDLRK